MKFVALISGGKDSIHSTLLSIRNNHTLICCAHLSPSPCHNDEESYMYQTAGSEALQMQVEECLGVPLYVKMIDGRSRDTSLVYQDLNDDKNCDDNSVREAQDEVEDLYQLLKQVLANHPEITAVSSGAILSTYQRTRIENVCSRLHLTSLAYLWRSGCQSTVLDEILDDEQMEAVLVRVACPPGLTCRHLGQSLRKLRNNGVLDALNKKYHMHVAGEGGEYETLVLDCELFKFGRLILEETEVVGDDGDGTGVLRIVKCRVETKKPRNNDCGEVQDNSNALQQEITAKVLAATPNMDSSHHHDSIRSISIPTLQHLYATPNIRIMRGGLCHISAIISPTSSRSTDDVKEAELAVGEFLSILQILETILHRVSPCNSKPQNDILFVHIYLSQISHFSNINAHYKQFFGMHLPPSRSCVGVGYSALPGGRRIMLDCMLQLGSGKYLITDVSKLSVQSCGEDEVDKFVRDALKNKHHALRKTLHVQSISNWAPVCIGPYSQATIWRSCLVFLAGMIGLIPESMTLIQSTCSDNDTFVQDWEVQLYQSWRNAASVLDGLEDGGGKLDDCLSGLVYFSLKALEAVTSHSVDENNITRDLLPWCQLWSKAESICQKAIEQNGGIVMGSVDGIVTSDGLNLSLYDNDGVLYGGYEDEETWREMTEDAPTTKDLDETTSNIPLLMVCLAELPMNAQAEVELVCASRRANICLDVSNGRLFTSPITATSYSSDMDMLWDTGYNFPIQYNKATDIHITSISRCVGIGCACVSIVTADVDTLSSNPMNFDMEHILSEMVSSAIVNAAPYSETSSLFDIRNVLNVRLYYLASMTSKNKICSRTSVQVDVIDDGTALRTSMLSILTSKSHIGDSNDTKSTLIPACTVVPVIGMHLSTGIDCTEDRHTFLAMQVTMVDAIRMETEMWVRHGRTYNS